MAENPTRAFVKLDSPRRERYEREEA